MFIFFFVQLAFKSEEMKCSVPQEKSSNTKCVIQQVSTEAVGFKSKRRICVEINVKSVHESKKMSSPTSQ